LQHCQRSEPTASARRLQTAVEKEAESKKMRLGKIFNRRIGKELEDKKPTKKNEEKIVRKCGTKIIKHAIRNCVDADTALGKNMTKCIKKEGRAIRDMVRGDDAKKNKLKDLKDALKEDAREQLFKCMDVKDATRKECVKKFVDRLKKTRDEEEWPQPKDKTKPKARDDKKPVLEETEDDKMVRDAAWKFASDEADLKEQMGGPLDKANEKLARDARKEKIRKSGVETREVDNYDMLGSELKIIKDAADSKKAGKTDAEIEKEMEDAAKANKDTFDFTDKKKKEMKTAVDAIVAGDEKGDLKLKPEKKVYCRVCMEGTKAKDLKIDDVKKLVTDNKKAKDVADERKEKVEVLEKPAVDKTTERSCGTASYPPKGGKTAKQVKDAFADLEKKARRALRMLTGRDLAEGASTSSGEVNSIVPGDDDSVATNPAADYTMLIVGVVIGCLCLIALAVLVYMVMNKKKDPRKAPKYTPHAEL